MKFKKFKKTIRKLEAELPDDVNNKLSKKVLKEVPKKDRNMFIEATFDIVNLIKFIYGNEENEDNINIDDELQDEFLSLSIEVCPECKKMTIKK